MIYAFISLYELVFVIFVKPVTWMRQCAHLLHKTVENLSDIVM